MKNKKIMFALLIVVSMIAAAFIGCAPEEAPVEEPVDEPDEAAEPEEVEETEELVGVPTVIYGGAAWLGHYPTIVGMEAGTFEDQGIRVSFQQFGTSAGRMGALAAGQIDVASSGSIGAMGLMAAGHTDFYAIGTQDSYATLEGIVAPTEIETVEDLEGKQIAVTFASSAHNLLIDILAQHGLTQDDVELINLSVYDMITAMRSEEIDAAVAWTPAFEQLNELEGTHVLATSADFSLFQEYGVGPGPDMLVASKKFVDENPELARRFFQGFFDAIEFMKANPEQAAEYLIVLTGLDLETQIETLEAITWYSLEDQYEFMVEPGTFVEGLNRLSEFMIEHGIEDREVNVEEWVNLEALPLD